MEVKQEHTQAQPELNWGWMVDSRTLELKEGSTGRNAMDKYVEMLARLLADAYYHKEKRHGSGSQGNDR